MSTRFSMGGRRSLQTSLEACVALAGVGLCLVVARTLVAAPVSGQTTAPDGSTGALGGAGELTAGVVGGLLMDNGCIGNGSGWSVSGTNGPFGGFTQFQRFTVPDPGWNINAIGVEGHITINPNGTGMLGSVWPDDGTGTGPDKSGAALKTALYFLANDPFSCENWQDESTSICLEPGDYWFQWDDDDDRDYIASAKNGTSGGPAYSRRNSDLKEFPHGPLAVRIFGSAQACVTCPGEGDCCQGNNTPGCDDEDCCNAVCALDPFCCEDVWDDLCADQAADVCFPLCGSDALLDIKPGSCPNSFNRNSHGVLPTALVGTGTFDVSQVDLETVGLSRADGVGGTVGPNEGPPGPHSTFEDVATPFEGELCDCHELEGDGTIDLSMKFRSDDVVDALELDDLQAGDLVELCVNGSLLDGTPFEACDCIRLVPPGTPPGSLAVGANLPGIWVDISPVDEQTDGGGFTNLNRTYLQSTAVTLTAPVVPYDHPNWVLAIIWIDGVSHMAQGDGTVGVTIEGEVNSVALQYRQTQFNNPAMTPGIGGNTRQQ